MALTIRRATEPMLNLVVVGILFQVIGGVIAGLSWPGTSKVEGDCSPVTLECDPDKTVDTGSLAWSIVGLGLGGVGSVMLLIGAVGFGVWLGIRARDELAAG